MIFQMLNQLYIPGIYSTWSRCIILASILLKMSADMFMRDINL